MTTQRDARKSKAGVIAPRALVTVVCLTVCLLGGGAWFGGATASAQTVDPYEVIVYEQPNFAGKSASFKLNPATMRQRLVPCHVPYKISSIPVGSKVAVELFLYPGFIGRLYEGSPGIRLLHAHKDLSQLWADDWDSGVVFYR